MLNKIMTLFRGLQRAHGIYNISKAEQKKRKVGGDAVTKYEPVTEELWQKHLDGKQGIGIVPITDNNTCWFGAIDIDNYELDLNELDAQIRKNKLPLTLCRTKSGGAHLYLFLKDDVFASVVRKKLSEFCILLGVVGSEIFPKQERLASDKDVGNWINMPYFGGDKTERYAIYNGKKLSLSQFIARAMKTRVTEEQLLAVNIFDHGDILNGAPPCLNSLASNGVMEGSRNSAMFNYCVYLRNRYGDSWKGQVAAVNDKFFSPPLNSKEISVIVKSVDKKEYFFTCTQSPIASYCNKDLCRQCEFGIGYGQQQESTISLGGLTKIMTDPPIWIIDVSGIRFELASDDLLRQDRFRKLCMEKINIYPPRVKTKDWEMLINDRLANVELIEAPDDAGPQGLFWHFLRQYCTGPAQANTRDEILNGKVWNENDRVYFRSADLMAYLDRQKFKYYDSRKIWSILKDRAGAQHSSLELKGVKTRVWSIEQFDIIEGEFDVPQTTGAV